jgi:3'-phosphoadenosine 5'-phosphosulfate sulfotransferase (PAPS reductase)/FAD synthetase
MSLIIPDILTSEIFRDIQKTIERTKGSSPAVIMYHRDNFTTEVVASYLASLKVKLGLLFSFKSDSGVLALNTISRISGMYPGGVSFFYRIQDAFSHFNDNVSLIINLASDIQPEQTTLPNSSEKKGESSRAFKIRDSYGAAGAAVAAAGGGAERAT